MAEKTPPTGPSGNGEEQGGDAENAATRDDETAGEQAAEEQAVPSNDSGPNGETPEEGAAEEKAVPPNDSGPNGETPEEAAPNGGNGDGGDNGDDGDDGGDGKQNNELDETLTTLRDAVKESLKLLRYATRQGIEIPEENLKAIISASKTIGPQGLPEEKETEFWQSYRVLSQTVDPVSIDSVNACFNRRKFNRPWYLRTFIKRRITLAWNVALNYATLTLIVLTVLVFSQLYWIVGSNLTGDIKKIKAEVAELKKAKQPFKLNEKVLEDTVEALEDQKKIPKSDVEISEISAKISTSKSKLYDVQIKIEYNKGRGEELNSSLEAAFVLLGDWSDVWRKYFGAEPEEEPNFFSRLIESDEAKNARIEAAKIKADIEFVLNDQIALSSAITVLKFMSSYYLPLLYGLLGACAFILRTLAHEISTVTFSSASLVQFGLRWPLGMVAGIAVGWFFNTETLPEGLEALQPLALAFLAGYGVELLFTGLDKMVHALTGKAPGAKRTPAG